MQASDWVTAVIGVLTLGVAASALWYSMHQARAARLQTARQALLNLVFLWENKILSSKYAVQDDNWPGLVTSAKEWRARVYDAQTVAPRTRDLLQRAVEATKAFEITVDGLVPKGANAADHEDKVKVIEALGALQASVNPVVEELEALSNSDDLLG